jgi:hypothetical protein
MKTELTEQERAEALALIRDGKVTPDFAGLSDDDAVLVLMLGGLTESEARFAVALARGEVTGDVVGSPADYEGPEGLAS